MPEPLLHQWEISPFCAKVRKMLRFKGVAFQVENYNGLRARRVARLSPAGTLPVLDWQGERVVDSSAIAAFLEQRRPAPALYPVNPRDAALARVLEDWADESLALYGLYFRIEYAAPRAQAVALLCEGRPKWEQSVFGAILRRHARTRLDAHGLDRRTRPEIEASFLRLIDDLETSLRGRDWLVGEAQSIADIAVSAQLDEMVRTSTLADRIRARPNVARWLLRQGAEQPIPPSRQHDPTGADRL